MQTLVIMAIYALGFLIMNIYMDYRIKYSNKRGYILTFVSCFNGNYDDYITAKHEEFHVLKFFAGLLWPILIGFLPVFLVVKNLHKFFAGLVNYSSWYISKIMNRKQTKNIDYTEKNNFVGFNIEEKSKK